MVVKKKKKKKNLPAAAGDVRDMGSVLGSGKSVGEGNGKALQYSSLENPMDRGAWWATVHGVAKSGTRLKQLGTHAHILNIVLGGNKQYKVVM